MELLLLEDVAGIGKKDDLIVVGDGFALNNLLPSRKAIVATPTVRRNYAERIRVRAEQRLREQQTKQGAVSQVTGKTVTFSRKATKTGKLYAAITEKNISEAVAEQLKVDIPESAVQLTQEIKALGSFGIQVKMGDATVSLNVQVDEQK